MFFFFLFSFFFSINCFHSLFFVLFVYD